MKRPRFSLITMMVTIAFTALCTSALRSGSLKWFRAFYGVTLFTLLVAIISARYRPSRERAFWFGFAVFGWGYFLNGISHRTAWDAFGVAGQGQSMSLRANPSLPTEGLMEFLAELAAGHLKPQQLPEAGTDASIPDLKAHAMHLQLHIEARESAVGLYHLIAVWISGALGGGIAWLMAPRRGHYSADIAKTKH